ncbi:MAG: CCA tRNA nucleotidyltransferase, partial [Ilumatobacteraceae bacterium]
MVPERFAPVLAEVAPLGELFRAQRKKLFLVGGSVRDLLIDRATTEFDLDFTTDARPDEIKTIITGWADAIWTPGERFGTISAQKDGRTYEITTHRAEAYSPD